MQNVLGFWRKWTSAGTWRTLGEKLCDLFYPERLLRQSVWRDEWQKSQRERTQRVGKVFPVIGGMAWFVSFWLVDLPLHKEPIHLWFAIRMSMFAVGMGSFLAMYIPLFRRRYSLLPLLTCCATMSFVEGVMMLYSDTVTYSLVFSVLFITIMVLSLNLFWSYLYAVIIIGSLLPVFLKVYHGRMGLVSSGLVLTTIAVYYFRSRALDEIRAFINVRELAEARQKLLVQELELTGSVQKLLLPEQNLLNTEDFRLSATFVPAHHSGGDWWWFRQEQGKLRLILGDVTGHGAGPAMVTAAATTIANVLYDSGHPFEELVQGIQRHFTQSFVQSEFWMTLTAAEIDFDRMTIRSWFAAGPPILCLGQERKYRMISKPGNPVGMTPPEVGYSEDPIHSGERIIFMSDGIYEEQVQKTGNALEFGGACRLFQSVRGESDMALAVERPLQTLTKMRGDLPQSDDYTLVMIDVL